MYVVSGTGTDASAGPFVTAGCSAWLASVKDAMTTVMTAAARTRAQRKCMFNGELLVSGQSNAARAGVGSSRKPVRISRSQLTRRSVRRGAVE